MENVVLSAVLVLIIGSAMAYIIKAKKRGDKCIGCPQSSQCSRNQINTDCSCGCKNGE